MIKIAKYEFLDKEQAESKIKSLGTAQDENGNEYPTHKHTIVQLGNIVLKQGQYDEEGNEVVAPVLSDKWHVDALWLDLDDHPYGWKSYAVDIDGNGVHSFLGLDYNSYKF
jgi:DNA polymerase III epsilon subunit-like protein